MATVRTFFFRKSMWNFDFSSRLRTPERTGRREKLVFLISPPPTLGDAWINRGSMNQIATWLMIRSLSHARAREREIEGTSLREERNSGIRSLKIPRHPLAPWSRSNALTLIETRYEGVAYILLYCHMWRNTRRRTIASRCVTLGEKKKGEMKEEYKPCRGGARCYSTLYSHYRPCCPYLEIYMDRCIGARCMRACKRKKRVSRPKLSRPLFFFAVSVFA